MISALVLQSFFNRHHIKDFFHHANLAPVPLAVFRVTADPAQAVFGNVPADIAKLQAFFQPANRLGQLPHATLRTVQ